jgi:hypothetical protein
MQARQQAQDSYQRADGAAKNVALAAERAVQNLQTIGQQMEVKFAQAADEVRRAADSLLKSSSAQLEKQSAEIAEASREKIRASQTNLIEETHGKLSATVRACLEGFHKEANAIADECRSQFSSTLRDSVVRNAPVESQSAPLQEPRRRVVLNQISSHELGEQELRSKLVSANRAGAQKGTLSVAASWVLIIASLVLILVGIFVLISVRPVMQLELDPPAEFFDKNPAWSAKRRAVEERLAHAYWESAIQGVQTKFGFRADLPDDPPGEFKAEGNWVKGEALRADSESRNRYWRKLRQVWVLPQAWHKSYVWSTSWAR